MLCADLEAEGLVLAFWRLTDPLTVPLPLVAFLVYCERVVLTLPFKVDPVLVLISRLADAVPLFADMRPFTVVLPRVPAFTVVPVLFPEILEVDVLPGEADVAPRLPY